MNMFMMHVGKFVGMCKLCFMAVAKFGGYEILTMEKFCWACDVGFWKILCGYDFCLCENLFLHGHELVGIFCYPGHVGIVFVHGYGKIW